MSARYFFQNAKNFWVPIHDGTDDRGGGTNVSLGLRNKLKVFSTKFHYEMYCSIYKKIIRKYKSKAWVWQTFDSAFQVYKLALYT